MTTSATLARDLATKSGSPSQPRDIARRMAGGRHQPELLHHAQVVTYRSMLRDQPIFEAVKVHVADCYLLTSRCDSVEKPAKHGQLRRPEMGSSHRHVGHDPVALGHQYFELEMEVGKGSVESPVDSSHSLPSD